MSLALSNSTVTSRPDPKTLAARARELLAQGRPLVARSLIAALRPAGASPDLAAELEARLLQAQGDLPASLATLDAALVQHPASQSLRELRAGFRLFAEDNAGAAEDAADAIIADRTSLAPKVTLGRALWRLGLIGDALACLQEALTLHPADMSVRFDLIEVLEALGNSAAADALLTDGIALAPQHPGARSFAILRRVRRKDFLGAVETAEMARAAGALDGAGFGLLGHALSCLGEHDAAADAYMEALKLVPTDPYVRHLAAAAGRVAQGDQAPPEYVRVLFNGYADRFDEHLIHLGYRVPGLIRARLAATPKPGPVLDLGCGTGLLAVAAIAKTDGPWIGVDLAPRMLDTARAKNLYAELHEADLLSYLAGEQRRFPLVLAGDVLCYFGALHRIFTAIAPRLDPGGHFILTVERSAEDAPFKLGRMGRFTHSASHLQEAAAAAGLRTLSVTPEELRHESGRPVLGYLVTLERPA